MTSGALEGISVLDFTQGVAGPYATKQLSDNGADVIKIERPGRGDVSRRFGPFPGDHPHVESSGMYLELNTGKRSVTLDLASASGRGIARRLAADANLVIESFRPGTMERFGLGPDDLAEAAPRAAYVRISNFGQTGPYRDFEADDLIEYAMGGVLWTTRDWGREPVKIGLYAPLFLAGSNAAAFALGALHGSLRSGVGEHADVSIHEILTTSMDRGGTNLVGYQYSGDLYFAPEPAARTTAMPAGIFPCADGYVTFGAGPRWWDRFCRTIDRPDLIEDEHFVANLLDVELAPEIDAIFFPWLMARTKQEIMERGQREGLPVSALNTAEDVMRDPHLAERGFFQHIEHPVAGGVDLPGNPLRMSDTPGSITRAPLLGEHTSEVLRERLGYGDEEIVILRQRGVV